MDVLITQTPDGGEISFVNGSPVLTDGFENAVYLSLFGGNQDDGDGQEDAAIQWWGNLSEADPAKQYRSELQKLLRSIPAIPANLLRLQEAAERDLQWMLDAKNATLVVASASMPARNAVTLELDLEIDGKKYTPTFRERWSPQ